MDSDSLGFFSFLVWKDMEYISNFAIFPKIATLSSSLNVSSSTQCFFLYT